MSGIYKEDWDEWAKQGCSQPDCTHKHEDGPLVLTSACHPGTGLIVTYFHGIMEMVCGRCRAFVAQVAVASRQDKDVADPTEKYIARLEPMN